MGIAHSVMEEQNIRSGGGVEGGLRRAQPSQIGKAEKKRRSEGEKIRRWEKAGVSNEY